MALYFPSCNFTKACPETSAAIQKYLRERHGMRVAGCCRPGHKALAPGDTAVTVCHTCAAILRENVPEVEETNLLQFLDRDPDFPFPDLMGEPIAIQDCWRVRHNAALQAAARSLLRKMNVSLVELPKSRADADFCGTFRYSPPLPRNLAIAPRYFERLQAELEPLSPGEQQERLDKFCAKLPTARTACYCNSCLRGLKQGGAQGVHLLELLFPTA